MDPASPSSLRTFVGQPTPFPRASLEQASPLAAEALLGALLVRTWPTGERVVARIVETEAYREDDPASHSYVGRTRRTEPMFGVAGTAYVYRSYGIHWCCNVTVEDADVGAAVLLRAATVIEGLEVVRTRRPGRRERELLRGPGNLAAGLDIDGHRHSGSDLLAGQRGLQLAADAWRPHAYERLAGPRVGIARAADVPWRFWLAGVPEVSSYRRSARAMDAAHPRPTDDP